MVGKNVKKNVRKNVKSILIIRIWKTYKCLKKYYTKIGATPSSDIFFNSLVSVSYTHLTLPTKRIV